MKRAENYDAIVVGARTAGAATAMLLARRGMNVLALDRARYGSETLSTHALMRAGVLQLRRWGLLGEVIASGAPAVRRVVFHYPGERVAVDLKPADGIDALYAPRRTTLDPILADAAQRAGAEVRFGVLVDGLRKDSRGRVVGVVGRDDEGLELEARAGIVIGADGIRSLVAREAGAAVRRESQSEGACLYAYFRGVEAAGYEWAYAPGASAGVIPTNGGEVCVFVGCSTARFRERIQLDLEAGFRSLLEEVSPDVARRVAEGEQVARLRGFAGVRGYLRDSFGEGWALVGDAGYFRDPITTHGITDAFRDAELLARAIAGDSTLEEYAATRDAVTSDLFEVTERIAAYDWTMDEIKGYLREVSRAMKAETALLLGLDALEAA